MKRKLVITLGVALALVVILLISDRDAKTPDPDRQEGKIELFWPEGETQSYRFSTVTDVHLELDGQDASEFRQVFAGTLLLRIFDVDPEYARVGFQLESPRYEVAGQRDEALEERLSTPFFARFERTGMPISFDFPAWLPEQEKTLMEEAIRTFQFRLPADWQPSWNAEESHATGTYRAHYEVTQTSALDKQKTDYLHLAPNVGFPGDSPSARVLESQARLWMSRNAWINAAVVREELEVTGSGLFVRTKFRSELTHQPTLESRKIALFDEHDPEGVRRKSWAKPAPERSAQAQSRIDHRLSSADALDAILEQWSEHETSRVRRLKELLTALDRMPSLVSAITSRVRAPKTTSKEAAMMIHALERSGTPEAQAALADLMADPELHFANRLRSIVALGGVMGARDETVDALFEQSLERGSSADVDLSNTALLSLGSIATGLHDSDPARSVQLVDELQDRLAAASNSNETGMVIKALGNAHDPDRSGVIEPYLDHHSEFVRGSAARAIGSLDDGGAADKLAEQLVAEESPRVRMAVADGLAQVKTPTQWSVRIVAEQIRGEPQAATRRKMATYLGENVSSDQLARVTLKELAIADPSASVRRYATSVLHR